MYTATVLVTTQSSIHQPRPKIRDDDTSSNLLHSAIMGYLIVVYMLSFCNNINQIIWDDHIISPTPKIGLHRWHALPLSLSNNCDAQLIDNSTRGNIGSIISMMTYNNHMKIYKIGSCFKYSMVWPCGVRLKLILVVGGYNAHMICTRYYVAYHTTYK